MQQYAGASLLYVRHLLGAKPRWATAATAAKGLPLVKEGDPALMAVCFYGSVPHGHCGLYIGDGLVLTHDHRHPVLYMLRDASMWGGPYLGHVDASIFRASSQR